MICIERVHVAYRATPTSNTHRPAAARRAPRTTQRYHTWCHHVPFTAKLLSAPAQFFCTAATPTCACMACKIASTPPAAAMVTRLAAAHAAPTQRQVSQSTHTATTQHATTTRGGSCERG